MTLSQLPYDLLSDIYSHLCARDFLTLASTCRSLYSNRDDDGYWKQITENTFRLPNRPTLGGKKNNSLWPRLYRRLLLQTRIYQWGEGESWSEGDANAGVHVERVGPLRLLTPTLPSDWGIIADLQCGGWSTAFLNNYGRLFVTGILNGEMETDFGDLGFRELQFEAPDPQGPPRSDPASPVANPKHTIRRFSSGRNHILALSDDGTLWSWFSERQPAVQLSFPDIDESPVISKFVAGWSRSSAYIKSHGILVWEHVNLREQQYNPNIRYEIRSNQPGHLWVVDQTSYVTPKGRTTAQHQVGEVVSYVVLEQFIVFVTDIGKVFGCSLSTKNTFEIPSLSRTSQSDATPSAIDVQGSFRKFAIFKNSGEVVITDQDFLVTFLEQSTAGNEQVTPPRLIPALQDSGVISIAFGDYHFHALHSDGAITSYGRDPGDSGSLGLAGTFNSSGAFRGVDQTGLHPRGTLLPYAYIRGRKIWFHEEQYRWLQDMARKTANAEQEFWQHLKAEVNFELYGSISERHAQLAEWFEQQGDINVWAKRPGVDQSLDDGLGPYFALSVTAGGWRSAALVLVNDELANSITASTKTVHGEDAWMAQPPVRVTLPDGQDSTVGTHKELLTSLYLPPLSPWKSRPRDHNIRYTGNASATLYGVKGWEDVS